MCASYCLRFCYKTIALGQINFLRHSKRSLSNQTSIIPRSALIQVIRPNLNWFKFPNHKPSILLFIILRHVCFISLLIQDIDQRLLILARLRIY